MSSILRLQTLCRIPSLYRGLSLNLAESVGIEVGIAFRLLDIRMAKELGHGMQWHITVHSLACYGVSRSLIEVKVRKSRFICSLAPFLACPSHGKWLPISGEYESVRIDIPRLGQRNLSISCAVEDLQGYSFPSPSLKYAFEFSTFAPHVRFRW
jgi:hypothetical protein